MKYLLLALILNFAPGTVLAQKCQDLSGTYVFSEDSYWEHKRTVVQTSCEKIKGLIGVDEYLMDGVERLEFPDHPEWYQAYESVSINADGSITYKSRENTIRPFMRTERYYLNDAGNLITEGQTFDSDNRVISNVTTEARRL